MKEADEQVSQQVYLWLYLGFRFLRFLFSFVFCLFLCFLFLVLFFGLPYINLNRKKKNPKKKEGEWVDLRSHFSLSLQTKTSGQQRQSWCSLMWGCLKYWPHFLTPPFQLSISRSAPWISRRFSWTPNFTLMSAKYVLITLWINFQKGPLDP